jgi:hypothetical protein
MRPEGYILLMLKHLSARGSLFLFVRTHHHLAYYFKADTREAANEAAARDPGTPPRLASVVAIRPNAVRSRQ